MNGQSENKKFYVNLADLTPGFPTHHHSDEFWAALGRAIATFGFLEEILGKAIFSFTGTRRFPVDEVDAEYQKWLPVLERALSDQLGKLIGSYETAVRSHNTADVPNLAALVVDLRNAAVIRNALCHGSWRPPDAEGRSVPLFVNNKKEIFETAVDVAFLNQAQRHVAELSCDVINSVTQQGWQFPGSNGPGMRIYPTS